jgi:hypothetical protein
MGGVVRAIFGGRSKAPPAPAAVQAAAQPAATAPTAPVARAEAAIGSGYGARSTIMTGAAGLEGEANISKTLLGGGSRTDRRRMR